MHAHKILFARIGTTGRFARLSSLDGFREYYMQNKKSLFAKADSWTLAHLYSAPFFLKSFLSASPSFLSVLSSSLLSFSTISRRISFARSIVASCSSAVMVANNDAQMPLMSAPVRFCSFSPNGECKKMADKGVQPLNDYTCRFRPSSLKCTDKSGLDGLQADK